MCVECEDVPAGVKCVECDDEFCGLCYQWLHRKGKRAKHTIESVHEKGKPVQLNVEGTTEHFVQSFSNNGKEESPKTKTYSQASVVFQSPEEFIEQIKTIPLRLTAEERKLLSLLEGALNISEYTDKVDVSRSMSGFNFGFWSFSSFGRGRDDDRKDQVIQRELNEVFSLVSGLFTATDFLRGKKLVANNFSENCEFFQTVFEVGRRFKIMNPDKMRDTYGKLMHLLQDAVKPSNCSFEVITPIKTVYRLLKRSECLSLVKKHHKEFIIASNVVQPGCDPNVAQEEKRAAMEILTKVLVNDSSLLSQDELELCVNSINDYHSYIAANCYPVECMIRYMKQYFENHGDDRTRDLSIQAGRGGSYLTHSHSTQVTFCLQSLMLWHEIQRQMCELWILTDLDLLDPNNRYRLCNTGQGMNRVQAAPRISGKMSSILRSVQSRLSSWVGLSVVHLGDRDVPNALVFIDKYTQVPRILGPIVRAIELLEDVANTDNRVKDLIETKFEGVESSKISILRDYFRHGFDGSGDDGGSCIDGRLTSSWNWTSKIEKKSYYSLFKLGDFDGFDGEFR